MKIAKILLPVVMAMLLLINLIGVLAQDIINVNYNGKGLEFETAPYMKDDRVLVPLRKIMEAMGVQIIWDDKNQVIEAKRASIDVYMKIGAKIAYINNEQVQLDVPPEITNDSTFVPLRFVGESMGAQVNWDEQTGSITIKFDDTLYKLNQKINFGTKGFTLTKANNDRRTGKFIAEGTMDSGIKDLSLNLSDDNGYVVPMQITVTQKDGMQIFRAEADLPTCHNFIGKYVDIKTTSVEQKVTKIGEYILE